MSKFCSCWVVLVAFLFALGADAYAQFPAMRQQEWYKKNVLQKSQDGSEPVEMAPEVMEALNPGQSVLEEMRVAYNAKKYEEALALYPRAKEEYVRNPNTYVYARMILRALLNRKPLEDYLNQLHEVYNDFYKSGNGGEQEYVYSASMVSAQWNEGQWMKDWTSAAAELYDYETRYSRLLAYVSGQGEKADPALTRYLLMWLSEKHNQESAKLKSNPSLGLTYYNSYNELHQLFAKSESYLASLGKDGEYEFAEYSRLCKKNMWDVIPEADWEKVIREDLYAHQGDIAWLDDFLADSKRFSGNALYKQAESWREKLGIEESYYGYAKVGDSRMDNNKFKEAIEFYKKALELATNDEDRVMGNLKLSNASYKMKSYSQSYKYLSESMTLQEGIGAPMWAHHVMLVNLYINSARSFNYSGSADEIYNYIGYYIAAENALTEAQEVCSDANADQANQLKMNIRQGLKYLEKGQLFMKGVKLEGQTRRLSNPIPVSVVMRDVTK